MTYSTTFKIIFWFAKIIVAIGYLPIQLLRLFEKPKKCPPIRDNLLLLSASDLAERIREKKVTSETVVQAYISRINEVNPIINAVIENRFEEALKDAKKADELIRNSELSVTEIKEKYPLLGVPITIKGSIAVTGMVQSSGCLARNSKAKIDATVVKYAKEAGAIPLLMSNVPEFCGNFETSNKLVGTTRNPYNTTRTPGGSSGGEASLIGSGASLIGIGSDLGGSIRIPSHYCGIWGHKPSPHAVSVTGHYPEGKHIDEWKEVFTMGPMTRYAGDLRLLLNIIAEPEARDKLKLNQMVDLKNIKVYYMEDTNSLFSHRPSTDVIEALKKVVTHFEIVCGRKCTKIEEPLMERCTELSYLRVALLDVDIDKLFKGEDNEIYFETLKFFVGKSQHEYVALGYGLFKRNMHLISQKTVNKMFRFFEKLRRNLLEILGDDGILIIPTYPDEAPFCGDVIRTLFNYGNCAVFNMLGFPATNCPISFSRNGLPIGIQVVTAPYLDRLSLCVAEELERTFGGWKFN